MYKFELVRYTYMYIGMCGHNSSACHAYVMWPELEDVRGVTEPESAVFLSCQTRRLNVKQ